MARALVIVESPAKAKTINKFLGRDFTVKASMGHVRDLPKRELGVDEETLGQGGWGVFVLQAHLEGGGEGLVDAPHEPGLRKVDRLGVGGGFANLRFREGEKLLGIKEQGSLVNSARTDRFQIESERAQRVL